MKNKAIDLFNQYAGDFGQMHRDGVLDEYQSYLVSEEQETLWLGVLANDLLASVKSNQLVDENFHKLVKVIKVSKSKNSFFSVLQVLTNDARSMDSFSLMLACELLADAAIYLKREEVFSASDLVEAANKMASLRMNLSVESFSVAEYYKKGSFLPGAFSAPSIETRIKHLGELILGLNP